MTGARLATGLVAVVAGFILAGVVAARGLRFSTVFGRLAVDLRAGLGVLLLAALEICASIRAVVSAMAVESPFSS